MPKLNRMPIFTDTWIADTMHLTPAEDSAHFRLAMAAFRTKGCSLPNDDKVLARYTRDPRIWSRVKPAVMGLWQLGEDNRWRNEKLSAVQKYETARADLMSARNTGNALKRHRGHLPVAGFGGANGIPSESEYVNKRYMNGKGRIAKTGPDGIPEDFGNPWYKPQRSDFDDEDDGAK